MGTRKRSGKKPGYAKKKQRERFNSRHPEGRKVYSLKRRINAFKRTIAVMERKVERLENKTLRE